MTKKGRNDEMKNRDKHRETDRMKEWKEGEG